ncbi:unnamed protein product, partial [Musa hybrid cultivar]
MSATSMWKAFFRPEADLSHLSTSFTKWVVTDDDKHGNSKAQDSMTRKSRAFVYDSFDSTIHLADVMSSGATPPTR